VLKEKNLKADPGTFFYLVLTCWLGAARLIYSLRVKRIPNGQVLEDYQFPKVFLCQKKEDIHFLCDA
jgi:hypothetical protein